MDIRETGDLGGKRLRARLNVLSDNERSDVHEASMKILSEIGLKVSSERAAEQLCRTGANVNQDTGYVRFPREMVEGAIVSAQKRVTLFSRDTKHDCRLYDREAPALATDGASSQTLDYGVKEFRRSTSKDLFRLAVLSDFLREIELFWPMVIAGDVPESEHTLKEFAISLIGTGKHVQHEASGEREARTEIAIASAAVGGGEELKRRPIFSAVQCPVSPMTLEKGSVEASIEFSRAGIPIVGMSMALSGVTAPATLAGALTMSNAETLGSLVVSQVACEGAPFIYGVASAPVDIIGGGFLNGSPELALISAAAAQMATSYGLPSLVAGMITDAHYQSQQSGFEKLQTGLIPALAGPSIISGIGGIEEDNVASLEQLVIDCDIWGSIMRITRGIETNADTISFDLIRRLTPGHNYHDDMETAKRFRREVWQPRLRIRQSRTAWNAGGSKTIEESAHEIVVEALSSHHPVPMERDREKEIMRIYKGFQKSMRK
jgi:trimethylamine--corrinoid protein Co-methyltransferase